jgi:Rhs element Vgr protein
MAIETPISPSTAEFTLKVEGSINQDGVQVYGFHIDKQINKIPFAKIVILDGDIAKQEYKLTNGDDFVPGKEVTLLAGSVDVQEELFKGIIVSQKIVQNERGTLLEICVKDTAVRMTVGRKNAYFLDKSDDDILEEILRSYASKGISFQVDSAKFTVTHTEMVQYYCTDWDFLVSRAEASARVVMVDNGKITITTPEVTFNQGNFALVFGENTYNFEAEMDARNEYSDVVAKSWDYSERKVEEKEITEVQNFQTEGNISPDALAEDVIGLDEYLLQHGGNLNPVELELWAYSKMLRSRMSKIRGRAKVDGTSKLNPGDNITISKFTERYNGPAYVSGIRHEMSGESTWFTDVQFGYCEEWFYEKYDDIVDKPAAGLLPAVTGLMIGIVTGISNSDDPEGNHRIRVKMPMVDDDSEGVWARVTTLDAGEGHGVFFRPEVGDEVVLGFLDDDPRQPIVLGALFSSGNAEPEVSVENDDENYEKGIFTKSGLKVHFNDDEETVTIATKDEENKIVITAKDEPSILMEDKNGNKFEMNKDGILIESAKDITLKTAKGDVTVDGVNIEMAAQAQLKAEGSGSAEINSSGSTAISGSIVQIN